MKRMVRGFHACQLQARQKIGNAPWTDGDQPLIVAIEYRNQMPRINPLHSLQNKGAVRPANKAAGNSLKIQIAQYEMRDLLHRTVVIRNEQKAMLCAELMKQRVAWQ